MAIFLTGYETVASPISGPAIQVDATGATVFTNEEYEFLTGNSNASYGFLEDHFQTDESGNLNFVNDRYWFSENFLGAGSPITINRNQKPRNYGYLCGG